jgi:glucose-6-phosphate 1-dehydrogenase
MSLVEVSTPSGKKKSVGIAQDDSASVLTIVVLGATGDLAKKVYSVTTSRICPSLQISLIYSLQLTFPALFALFTSKLMPEKFHVVGVGRQPAAGKPAQTAAGMREHLCSNAGTSKAAGTLWKAP